MMFSKLGEYKRDYDEAVQKGGVREHGPKQPWRELLVMRGCRAPRLKCGEEQRRGDPAKQGWANLLEVIFNDYY